MVNRSANHVVFGYDFQVNAAIVLMLKNIEELKSLRLEGLYEDIELELENGSYILAQAKSVVGASWDFKNVRKNLKKALMTLSEGSKNLKVKELILITNSLNPLNEKNNYIFSWGESYRRYNTLPPSSKKIIDGYLDDLENPLDKEKFMIQVLPFETDDNEERYKVVKKFVESFIGKLGETIPALENEILNFWQNDIFKNASKEDFKIKLHKKDIIWPIICIITNVDRVNHEVLDLDDEVYAEVLEKYGDIIRVYNEKFELFTQVLYDYNKFESNKKNNEKVLEYIMMNWQEYREELALDNEEKELEKTLIQVILFNIIKNRLKIDRIKKRVKL